MIIPTPLLVNSALIFITSFVFLFFKRFPKFIYIIVLGFIFTADFFFLHNNVFFEGKIISYSYLNYFSDLFLLFLLIIYTYLNNITPMDFFALSFLFLGSSFMIAAENLIVFFIAAEFVNISIYYFIHKNSITAFRYLIYSSVVFGIALFGSSLLLLGNGNLELAFSNNYISLVGIVLLFPLFLFKIGAFPFHFWIKDIYETNSGNTLSLMSSVFKWAYFIFFLKMIPHFPEEIKYIIGIVAVLSIISGVLLAFGESHLEKLLGFSGIAHTGYILAVTAVNIYTQYPLFYLLMYIYSAFLIFLLIKYKSSLKVLFFILILTLAGLPVSWGFIAKIYLLLGLWQINSSFSIFLFLVIIIFSVISFGYYGRIILSEYNNKATKQLIMKPNVKFNFFILTLPIILLGLGAFNFLLEILKSLL